MVSVEHRQPRVFRNAMTAWIEKNVRNNGSTEYRICARELQNFDGVHRGIKVVSSTLVCKQTEYAFVTREPNIQIQR